MSVDSEALRTLSMKPGVYLFRDLQGVVLYVGKAKKLKSRVRSYFRSLKDLSPKNQKMVELIESVDSIVVGTEAEALILEANLIKEYQPRFNILLRDDKKYPYIKVTVREPFPRVYVTRRVVNDGSRYFGPYTSVNQMRQALEVVNRLHTVRSCRYNLPKDSPDRPCLDYHIQRCKAPCVGLQSESEYRGMIDDILQILEGDTEELRSQIDARMMDASEGLNFELAAKMRDVIAGLDVIAREQRVHRTQGGNIDIVGLARDGKLAAGVVLKVRRGLLLGRVAQRFGEIQNETDQDLLSSLVSRHYLGGGDEGMVDLPRMVLSPNSFSDQDLLEEILTEAAGYRVRITVPQRGEKRRLSELAEVNARQVLEDRIIALTYADNRAEDALFSLQDELGLKVVPRLMVCFDVSHMQGKETVASAVVFQNGEPSRADYRHM